jgi:hypothetical protein
MGTAHWRSTLTSALTLFSTLANSVLSFPRFHSPTLSYASHQARARVEPWLLNESYICTHRQEAKPSLSSSNSLGRTPSLLAFLPSQDTTSKREQSRSHLADESGLVEWKFGTIL